MNNTLDLKTTPYSPIKDIQAELREVTKRPDSPAKFEAIEKLKLWIAEHPILTET